VRQQLDGGALPSDRAARIGAETTAALDYIHRQGIVHRDVKPSNLMLDDYGSVRLADFGIARLLGATRITGTHQAIGTMAYIAPEQLEGGEVGPPTDIYSLGLVLIECLTGRRVFDGPPAEAAAARMSRDPHVPAELPGGWPAILAAMTARDPHARPSAANVRDHLAGPASDMRSGPATAPFAAAPVAAAAALHEADGTATMPSTPEHTEAQTAAVAPARRRRGRRPWAAVLLVGGLVAGAAIAGLLAYNAGSEGGSPPAPATTAVPVTTAAPPTLPPTTVPPTTLPPAQPDNRGKGNGGDAEKQIQKWLEELRKQFEDAQQGD
jgi:eukaryotic-like serine/threonine-protein kinase